MLKKKFIKEPIYKTEVMFLGNCDYKQMAEVIRKRGYDIDEEYFKDSDGAQLNFIDKENGIRIVWFESLKKDADSIGVAVHEIFHLVVRILDWKGIIITPEKNLDEVGAYLIEYYFREFYKFLYEKPKLQKTIRKNLAGKKTRR